MARLLVLHGPNLNLLGQREPEIYGHARLADIDDDLAARALAAGHSLESFQSNAEHELVNRVRGYEYAGYERTIDSHIKNLRRKIEAVSPDAERIASVYGVGYRIESIRSALP